MGGVPGDLIVDLAAGESLPDGHLAGSPPRPLALLLYLIFRKTE